MNPLQTRLAALRRRLRTVATVRGGCLALACLVGSVALACLIDQAVYLRMQRDLPALIRAGFLAAILVGSGYVAFRYLLRPLRAPADDLSLALKVEEQYPVLNDALASTVQFLQEGEGSPGVSPGLKREAIQRAVRLAQGCDFNKAIDGKGTRVAFACLAGSAVLAALFLFWQPSLATSALARVADPFGGHRWPGEGPQTSLEVNYPKRVGFGQRFAVSVTVKGKIPDKAVFEFQNFALTEPLLVGIEKTKDDLGTVTVPLDMTRQQRDFRFRVKANDAVSPADGWHNVTLSQPPSLAPLDGKPSPQIEVKYPKYTRLPSPHRPAAGSGNVEGVDGTHVRIRGATDRPIVRAWVEHKPVVEGVPQAALLGWMGRRGFDALPALAGGGSVWGRTYGEVKPGGREFAIEFTPRVKGAYVLVIEDAENLARGYEYDLRLLPDPLPVVTIVQPSGHQSVLPNADVTLRVRAEDEVYGIRDVYLEYRRKGADGKFLDDGPRRLPMYDPDAFAAGVPQVMSALVVTSMPQVPVPLPPAAFKPTRVETLRRWCLEGLAAEGEILVIQACARDFNDVPAFPRPGRSPVIELRVVARPALIAQLDDAQARLEQELLQLRLMQEKAIKKVIKAEEQWRATGKLDPDDLRELAEVEQTQKQIQARIGAKPDEGMRGELRRMEQVMKDNKLPASATAERIKAIKDELDRIARDHLPEIEPRLATARRDLENPADAKPPPPRAKGELPQAREHQEEVRRAIDDLLRFLENWADVQQVRGELRQILQEQRDLQKETQELELNTRKRDPKKQLPAHDEAQARRLGALQNELAQKTTALIEKMKRMAEEKAVKDGQAAESLRKAADIGEEGKLPGEMKDSGEQLTNRNKDGRLDPQPNRAAGNQVESIKTLERMLEALEEGRDAELERLVSKQKKEGKQLGDLGEKLEKLRKKAQQARNIADPKEREAALKKVAEEHRQVQEEIEKNARELRRLQAPQAGKALDQAGEKMEGAGRKLDQGEDPDEDLKDAEKRVKEAQEKLQQAQDRAEEELAREQMARIADRIKGIKERQDAAIAETERLHKAMLQQSRWTQGQLATLDEHHQTQAGLAKETASLKEKLKGALVFEHMLDKTVQTMEDAAGRITKRRKDALDWRGKNDPLRQLDKPALADEDRGYQATLRLQQDASKRLERMMDAIKPEPNVAQKKPRPKDDKKAGPKDPKDKDGAKEAKRPPGDNVPPLAQLKALRAEQNDVNERTRDFARRHNEADNLPAEAQAELNTIRQDQERLHELFRKMQQAAGAEGGNP